MKRVFVNGREVAPEDAGDAVRATGLLEGIATLRVEEHADTNVTPALFAAWRSDFDRRYARAIEGGRGWSSAAWNAYNLAFANAGATRGWPEHRGPLIASRVSQAASPSLVGEPAREPPNGQPERGTHQSKV